jgi:hypothetical protein
MPGGFAMFEHGIMLAPLETSHTHHSGMFGSMPRHDKACLDGTCVLNLIIMLLFAHIILTLSGLFTLKFEHPEGFRAELMGSSSTG